MGNTSSSSKPETNQKENKSSGYSINSSSGYKKPNSGMGGHRGGASLSCGYSHSLYVQNMITEIKSS